MVKIVSLRVMGLIPGKLILVLYTKRRQRACWALRLQASPRTIVLVFASLQATVHVVLDELPRALNMEAFNKTCLTHNIKNTYHLIYNFMSLTLYFGYLILHIMYIVHPCIAGNVNHIQVFIKIRCRHSISQNNQTTVTSIFLKIIRLLLHM